MPSSKGQIASLVRTFEKELLADWLTEQLNAVARHRGLIREDELTAQCTEFLRLFSEALSAGETADITSAVWEPVRALLINISRNRTQLGFTPSETAMFVFSLKKPLFARLRRESKSGEMLGDEILTANDWLDRLGLFSTEAYQKSREEIIARQQMDMLELSTPVVKLWDGILALPLIGTLDSARTQVVMESLLQRIVETASEVAILDITGVPTVDTLVAQHLMKTVTAARLMGADCIISGIRPQIAQTIVHLGVSLNDITTKSNLADAFQVALKRSGLAVTRVANPGDSARRSD